MKINFNELWKYRCDMPDHPWHKPDMKMLGHQYYLCNNPGWCYCSAGPNKGRLGLLGGIQFGAFLALLLEIFCWIGVITIPLALMCHKLRVKVKALSLLADARNAMLNYQVIDKSKPYYITIVRASGAIKVDVNGNESLLDIWHRTFTNDTPFNYTLRSNLRGNINLNDAVIPYEHIWIEN